MTYCCNDDCKKIKKRASHNFINEKAKYCKDCAFSDMINVNHKRCKCELKKIANFNYKGITPPTHCKSCALKDMVNVSTKLCIENDCELQCSYNNPDKKQGLYCKNHALKGMIDVTHKKCKICNKNSATFGKNIKEYCSKCVKENNIDAFDLQHKQCIICNSKAAVFNTVNKNPLYCGDCKTDGMINIHGPKCESCKKAVPTFNYEGLKKKRFCQECSLEGMINVKDKSCIKCNIKRPSFNNIEEKIPLYCRNCKDESMVNIYYDICEYEYCDENAYYNYEGHDKVMFCKEHSLKDMINIKLFLCIEINCTICPSFNFPKETKKLYCVQHKLKGMVDIQHKNCIYENCKSRSVFNNYGEKTPLYCNEHKSDLMVNLEHKLCKVYLCGKRSIEKYDDHCLTCFIHLFPDKPLSRNYKTKESEVVKYILDRFPNFSWVSDKKVIDGCSLKRPDLLLDLGYHVINIEIDENQHKSYEEICENKRLMMISKDIHHRPLILIRFNPDAYTIDGIKKLSCWNINKDGLCTIKKSYEKDWSIKLKVLHDTILYWIDPKNESTKMIEIIHLFFDK